jgi:hypothetical protein
MLAVVVLEVGGGGSSCTRSRGLHPFSPCPRFPPSRPSLPFAFSQFPPGCVRGFKRTGRGVFVDELLQLLALKDELLPTSGGPPVETGPGGVRDTSGWRVSTFAASVALCCVCTWNFTRTSLLLRLARRPPSSSPLPLRVPSFQELLGLSLPLKEYVLFCFLRYPNSPTRSRYVLSFRRLLGLCSPLRTPPPQAPSLSASPSPPPASPSCPAFLGLASVGKRSLCALLALLCAPVVLLGLDQAQ